MLSVSLHCGVEANSWKALPDVPAEKVPAYLSPFHKVIQILQLCVHNYRQHRARLALACLFSYCHQIPSNKYSNIFIKKKGNSTKQLGTVIFNKCNSNRSKQSICLGLFSAADLHAFGVCKGKYITSQFYRTSFSLIKILLFCVMFHFTETSYLTLMNRSLCVILQLLVQEDSLRGVEGIWAD